MKKVALALSSGGARGYAHIGVIETLEKYGFEIVSIAGSSMGAVVGGVYSAGKLNVYTQWVKSLQKVDVIKLLKLSFSKKGIFKEDKVMNFLKNLIGDVNIEDFKIRFTAVAVDIIKKKEVWIRKGSLYNALKASTAIPGIFTPFIKDGMVLVDGGVLNPLPIAPVLNEQVDLIIAVDVNSEKPAHLSKTDSIISKEIDENLNIINIMLQSVYLMQTKITKYQLANYSPDILIEIPRDIGEVFDFHRAEEIIEYGKKISEEVLSKKF